MVEDTNIKPVEEIVEGLNQKYIDSQDRRAKRLMSNALQHFAAAPVKWGIGGFILQNTATSEKPDLIVAAVGGFIVVWGFSDIGKGVSQFISSRDITKQVLTLRSALTRKLIDQSRGVETPIV